MILRAVEASDGDAIHAIFVEPGVTEFLFDGIPPSRAETGRHLDAARSHPSWTVIQDGEIAGFVTLRPSGNDDYELIVVIATRHWGQGLAYGAAQHAMRHGFDVLKLPRLLSSVDEPNQRSHRLMARLDFRTAGDGPGPKFRQRFYEATP